MRPSAAVVLATSIAVVTALPSVAQAAETTARTAPSVARSGALYGPPTGLSALSLSRKRVIVQRKRPVRPAATAPTSAPVVRPATVPVAPAPTSSPVVRPATVPPAPAPVPTAVPVVPAPTAAPLPVPPPVGTVDGPPSTTARGSFVERPCTRSYGLDGLQVGATGDPLANGNRLRAVLASAVTGDCITVAPGLYRLAGNVEFTVPGITLKGLGATREDVWFEHTTETRAIFKVVAADVHLYNFTHRVHGTARSSLGESGEGNIWVMGGHTGFRMQDVLAWGSRDAAIFLLGVHRFELNRVESRDSRSDAFHISAGSSYGTWYDSTSRNSGDDGLGFVGYDAEGSNTPHHHTVVRHHVDGQSWGRGIGVIHASDITVVGPTLIERTAGAGILIAREPHYGSGSVRRIRIEGELRMRQVNTHATIDHGAILIDNPTADGVVEGVVVTGPVLLADTGALRPGGVGRQIRASGAGPVAASVAGVSFYGTGPATRLQVALPAGSSLSAPDWGNSTPYRTVEPAFPLGG